MREELFGELLASCNEAIEHSKGNLELKTNKVSIPDDEMDTVRKFYDLSEQNKHIAKVLINELYQASVQP